jgi:prophage tail gpP-like protein
MPLKESTLVVRLPGLGIETTAVTSWSIESDYLKSTDGFEFELWPFDASGEQIGVGKRRLELQPVELILNGSQQLVGRIDRTTVGGNGSMIRCQGRDFMADLVECNVDPTFKVKAGMTLQDVIFAVGGPVGVDAIVGDDEGVSLQDVRTGLKLSRRGKGKGSSKRKQKLEDYNPKPGEGIYEYLVRLTARQGVTLQPGIDRGTIIISSPWYDQEPMGTLRRSSDATESQRNNVKTSTADRDYSRMPTYALFNGFKAKPGKPNEGIHRNFDIFELAAKSQELLDIISAGSVSDRWKPGQPAANEVAQGLLYRLLYFRDDEARTQDEIENSTKRAISERLKDSLSYNATVRGHTDGPSGGIYSINTMLHVEDEIANVFEPLWVASRTLAFSDTEGATTQITAWRPESFVL